MNLAQKIAVAVTLIAVAMFLFNGGHTNQNPGYRRYTEWPETWTDVTSIVLVGGATVLLLGIRRRKSVTGT